MSVPTGSDKKRVSDDIERRRIVTEIHTLFSLPFFGLYILLHLLLFHLLTGIGNVVGGEKAAESQVTTVDVRRLGDISRHDGRYDT